VDLSKAYDRVSWLYLRLILIHLGFCHQFVVWVMNCITFASFVVLINGATSPFFRPGRGLRQGFPLSPLLFLLIVEGLSRLLKEAFENGSFKGVNIGTSCNITHLLFVDDILIFCEGSRRVVEKFRDIMDLFCKVTCMKINLQKSTISLWGISE
jgi:hypothetical protein